MKVNELLSTVTIGSSRTLSIYSATLIAVSITETPFKNVPILAFLNNASENTLAIAAIVILAFVAVSHSLNWQNDVVSRSYSESIQRYEKLHTGTVMYAPPDSYMNDHRRSGRFDDKSPDFGNDADTEVIKAAFAAEKEMKVSRRLNYAITGVMHYLVPNVLAIVAFYLVLANSFGTKAQMIPAT